MWASTALSRPSGRAWPANPSARDAVTAAHPATTMAALRRSAGGSNGRGGARRSSVPVASAKLMRPPLLPWPRSAGLQAVGPGDRLRGDQGGADLELDLGMLRDRDVARVAVIDLVVVDRGDVPLLRADLTGPQRLSPYLEEVAQREGPVDRRLGVDDAVGGVRVQPVEALPVADERALR